MSDNRNTEPQLDQFDELVSEFSRLVREGKSPDINEFASRNKELASRVERLFPILEMMEGRGDSWDGSEVDQSGVPCLSDNEKWNAPKRIGEFRIIRQIGRGGMGIVFEAEQESLGRRVAIKILPASAQFDRRRRERFATEAKASAMLHHTNIVPVFGIGNEDGLSFFVMQYIDGQPLSRVINDIARIRDLSTKPAHNEGDTAFSNPEIIKSMFGEAAPIATPDLSQTNAVPGEESNKKASRSDSGEVADLLTFSSGVRSLASPDSESGHLFLSNSSDSSGIRVRNYFRNVAKVGVKVSEALAYAHGKGILHRDIKPSNLLLDEQGVVWVTDFGLAKSFDSPDITRTGEVVGTLRYMSPEQLNGDATAGSDIFGLGLTLYEMLTLQPAYPGADRKRLFERVTEANPSLPRSIDSRIPRDLETIVMKCIHSEPAKRYSNAANVAEDLNRFLEGQPILARRISVVEKAMKWCQRKPMLAAAFSALLLSIVLGIAGVGWQWNKTVAALGESKTATARAEKHYNQARAAVVQITEAISNEVMLSTPELESVRAKLLKQALVYQVEFAETHPDDVDIQIDLADTSNLLANIQFKSENPKEALALLEDSEAITKHLLDTELSQKERAKATLCLADSMAIRGSYLLRNAKDGQVLFFVAAELIRDGRDTDELAPLELAELARINQRLGLWAEAQDAGRPQRFERPSKSALDFYMRAFELAQKIPEDIDRSDERSALLASVHRDLGVAHRRMRNHEEALKHYQTSVEQFRILAESDPKNTDYRYSLAEALGSLGFFYGIAEGKHEMGISFFTEAIKEYRKLSAANPSVLKFTTSEARVSMNCGMLLEDEEEWDRAFEFRIAAVRLTERTLLFQPDSAKLVSNYGKALMGLGVNCTYRGDNETALEFFAKAREQQELALEKVPDHPRYQLRHIQSILQSAQTYLDMGNYAMSLEACMDTVAQEPGMEGSYLAGRELLRLAYEIKVNLSDIETRELKIADEAIEKAKEIYKKLSAPKFAVIDRIMNDVSFEEVVASNIGKDFIDWLEKTGVRVAEAAEQE